MTTVSIHEAKTHLSRLIKDVLAGKEVVVANGKKPVARIIPWEPVKTPKRELGWLAHTAPSENDPLEDGFWDPLPDDHLGL